MIQRETANKTSEEAGREEKRVRDRQRGVQGTYLYGRFTQLGEPGPLSQRRSQIITGSEAEKEAAWSVVIFLQDGRQSYPRWPGEDVLMLVRTDPRDGAADAREEELNPVLWEYSERLQGCRDQIAVSNLGPFIGQPHGL